MSELSASLDLPLGLSAPTGARHTLRQILLTWGYADGDWLDEAGLLISELVGNAVRHGGGCLEVRVQAHGAMVTVSAADGSSVIPRRREPGPHGGLGLALIERFAAGWGVEDHHGGKRVWIRLRAYPAGGDDDRADG
ncbi:ATP-binding protein [Catellatospora sp. NPDC049609]|uniref:ATP-binding protein n=1 Tax=Catellatospora sp. NPDC049609 TaxID=3155505 RepID=UPI00341A4CD9